MRPRHQPLAGPSARPAADPPKAARLRWFLAAHLLAVLLIYATAVVVGGGLASTPFPPDRPIKLARTAPHPAPAPNPVSAATPAAPLAPLVLPTAAPDVAPPWARDGARRTE